MNRPSRKLRKRSPHSSTSVSASSNTNYHHTDRQREQDSDSILASEFGALSRLSSFEVISHPDSRRHQHYPGTAGSSSSSPVHAQHQRQRLQRLQQLSIASLSTSPLSPRTAASSLPLSPASTISPITLIPSVQSMHWLFRSNVPSKQTSHISTESSGKGKKRRNTKSLRGILFGINMGSNNNSIVGLNEQSSQSGPRSLSETKHLLEEARRDLRRLEAHIQAQEVLEGRESRHERSKSKTMSGHKHGFEKYPVRTSTIKAMPAEIYFHRVREEEILSRMLNPESLIPVVGQQAPRRRGCQWIVVAGAEGCGKTSLLHQVLGSPQGSLSNDSPYLCVHLDLRFSPFGAGDMEGLYTSLNSLMVNFCEAVVALNGEDGMGEGWEVFESTIHAFKHDRTAVERRLLPASSALTTSTGSLKTGTDLRAEKRSLPKSHSSSSRAGVKTSDIARLLEMFQAALVKYWDFEPRANGSRSRLGSSTRNGGSEAHTSSSRTKVEGDSRPLPYPPDEGTLGRTGSRRWGFMAFGSTGRMRGGSGGSRKERRGRTSRDVRGSEETTVEREHEKGKEREENTEETLEGGEVWAGKKKLPVIFIDDAQKLSQLIPPDTLKCLLDSLLVLSKQNRLCHVVQASSDPFYQSWLRSVGVLSGCKVITLGDLSKHEARRFYREYVFPRVPERMRGPLNFEVLWDAFGGRMAHWMDYAEEFVGSGGVLDVKQSSHFLQAHTLLNLHIINASQAPGSNEANNQDQGGNSGGSNANGTMSHPNMSNTDTRTLHPGLGPAGFKAYLGYGTSSMDTSFGSAFGFPGAGQGFPSFSPPSPPPPPPFSAMQLLKVISRLSLATTGLSPDGMTTVINPGGEPYLAYFHLCRELGVRAVDGMVRAGVLDLRWSECIGVGMPLGPTPSIHPHMGSTLHTRDSTMVGPGPAPTMPIPMVTTTGPVAPPMNQSVQPTPPAYLAAPDRRRHTAASAFDADSAHAPSPAAMVALSAAGMEGLEDEDEYDIVPVDIDAEEDQGERDDDDEILMARSVNPAAVPLPPSVAPSVMMQSTAHLPLTSAPPPPLPSLPSPPPPPPPAEPQYPPYHPYQLPANLPPQSQYHDSEYYARGNNPNDDGLEGEVVGPKLVPITPIMRYAMREVVQEYEDDQSVSEYASLSDVDEY